MNDGQQNKHPQEEEIDLLELALKVWAERRWILKCCGYAVIVGLVIAFSIPKEYTATATIAPELSDGKSGGGLSSLAAMAGFNINTSSGADAIYPDLYPDIVSSTPFITGLFNIPVKDLEGKIDTTLYCYLDSTQNELQEEQEKLLSEIAELKVPLTEVQEDLKKLRDIRYWVRKATPGTEESKEPPKKQPIKEVLQDKADEKKAQRTAPAQAKHRQQDMEL